MNHKWTRPNTIGENFLFNDDGMIIGEVIYHEESNVYSATYGSTDTENLGRYVTLEAAQRAVEAEHAWRSR
jgi:hypothetical protein